MTLSEKLRKLRLSKKMSQFDVAFELGISQSTYAAWENSTLPRTKYLSKLASLLSCEVSDLIDGTNLSSENIGQNKDTMQYLIELNLLQNDIIQLLKNENHRLHMLVNGQL